MNLVLTERLVQYINPWKRLGIPRTRRLTGRLQRYVSDDKYDERGRSYHQARIRFFLGELKAGKALDPIIVDNACAGGFIYPEPVLEDGHHRFAAAILFGAKKLAVHYGGRIDLLRYLQGRRKTRPQE